MLISPVDSIFVIVLLSSVLILITAVGISLALKFKRYRSRPYLLSCCLILLQSLGIAGILLRTMVSGRITAHFEHILRPSSLITGFMTLYCACLYLFEIKRPGKLNFKSLLLSISPFIIAAATLILIHPGQLNSLEEVLNGFKNPDVWLRLIIVVIYFVYPVAVICQPYDWRRCLVSRKMVVCLQTLCFLIAPAFITGLMCGYFPAIVSNYILAMVFDALVAYIEFKVRIPVTELERHYESDMESEDTSIRPIPRSSLLESPEIWMNPDMTAPELVRLLGTNHSYLSKRIKSLGYLSYADMINRKRVEFICEELKKGSDESIINLMFEAGFRSRSTASREFKRIVGCTPSEYKKSLSNTE